MSRACECSNEHSGLIKCGISGLAEDLLDSQEGLCSTDLVTYDCPESVALIMKI